VSYASRKGYRCERDTREYLRQAGITTIRPRTTSYAATDLGDLTGLPMVVSCKDWATMALSAWCDELSDMVDRSPYDTGLIVHRRRGRSVSQMYVTTTLGLVVPLIDRFR
jgi:hypothetical protein